MATFQSLNLSPITLNALARMGFVEPTPVQGEAIPILLAGRDLVAQARTGTGKTAAFGIPLVERLAQSKARGPVALVLVPTRELATQVAEELAELAHGTPLRVAAVYGGVGMNPQVEALRSPQPVLLVATPGRLLDHLQQRTARLDHVQVLVLDEADRMLDMGFLPDVERVLKTVPPQRLTALFSATLPEPIRKLSAKFLRDPAHVRIESGPTATPLAEQFVVKLHQNEKARALAALLQKEQPDRAIVFTRTKHLARRLAQQLGKQGWNAVALQGNMSQSQRERALAGFRGGQARILVATDIASRGLDIPEVTHIVNYDVPNDPDAYVHRVGRTARMGREGRAFTFVQPDQSTELRDVERAAGLKLEPFEVGPLPPPSADTRLPGERPPFHAPFSERRGPPAPRMRAPQQRAPQPRAPPPQRFASAPPAQRHREHAEAAPSRTDTHFGEPPSVRAAKRGQGWRQRNRASGGREPSHQGGPARAHGYREGRGNQGPPRRGDRRRGADGGDASYGADNGRGWW